MTSKGTDYPTRIPVTFRNKKGQVVLDQIRTVDKAALVKKMGILAETTAKTVSRRLAEMFTY